MAGDERRKKRECERRMRRGKVGESAKRKNRGRKERKLKRGKGRETGIARNGKKNERRGKIKKDKRGKNVTASPERPRLCELMFEV